MNRTTTLFLLLLVGLLGVVAGWQWQRESQGGGVVSLPERIFPGLEPARVRRIKLENLERAVFVVFETDEERRWQLVEPMEFPAEEAYPAFFMQIAEHNELVPLALEGEADLAGLGLDPPRAVLTFVEETPEGEREHVVEVGAVDADPQRIVVRVRETLWTTQRNIEATMDHQLATFRARRILDVLPRTVVEIHRKGTYLDQDVELDTLLDTGEWRMTRPLQARLDPVVVGHIVVTACLLEAAFFVDTLQKPLPEYGLDPAEFELTLVTLSDERVTLKFGRSADEVWHVMREGGPHVFGVDAASVRVLGLEARGLLDRTVVRATRDDLEAIVLRRGGRDLRIERASGGGRGWIVRDGAQEYTADPGALRDLLGQIEDLELGGRVDAEVGVMDAFEVEAQAGGEGFVLELRGGANQGGSFGGPFTLTTGDQVRLFRRRGDTAIGWVDPRAAELLEWTLEDLRSLNLMDGVLEEHQVARLVFQTAGAERAFVRDTRGRWRPEGSSLEAHELVPVLDKLFFLRGAKNLPSVDRETLGATVTVTFVDVDGNSLALDFGQAPDAEGRVELELLGRRATPADAELYQALLQIVQGEADSDR